MSLTIYPQVLYVKPPNKVYLRNIYTCIYIYNVRKISGDHNGKVLTVYSRKWAKIVNINRKNHHPTKILNLGMAIVNFL